MLDLKKNRALGVFADELVYLEACLTTDPATEHVAEEVSDELVALDKVLKAERDIHRKGVLNRAQVKMKFQLAEAWIREVYAASLFEVMQDRKDQRYQNLFKYEQSSLLRMTAKSQLEEVLRMTSILKLSIYEDGFRDTQIAKLEKALTEINGIIDARADLEEQQMHHRLEVEQCKDRVNKVRARVYGELVKISSDTGKSKSWARSFFPETKAAKKLSPEEIAKKNAAKAKRASDKAALAAEVAAEKSRKAEAKSKLVADKKALDVKSTTELEDEAKVRVRIRAQIEADMRAKIEDEERAKLREKELEDRIREELEQERLERELNGGGDSAQV